MIRILKIAAIQPKKKVVDTEADKVVKNPLATFGEIVEIELAMTANDPTKQSMDLEQAIAFAVNHVSKEHGQNVAGQFKKGLERLIKIEPSLLEDALLEAKHKAGDPESTDEVNKRFDRMRRDLDSGFKFDQMKDQVLDNRDFNPKLTPDQQKNRMIELSKKQLANIKLSKAQWEQIGIKTGWLK